MGVCLSERSDLCLHLCQNKSSVRSPLDQVLQRFIVLTPILFQFHCKSHLEYSIAVVFGDILILKFKEKY